MGEVTARRRLLSHRDLDVYKKSFRVAMVIFRLTKSFPKEETYSLIDQVRRSSRAASAMIAEAWRRRRYIAAFMNKLNEAEMEAAETQVWLEFAVECEYLDRSAAREAYKQYEEVLAMLVAMQYEPEKWLIPLPKRRAEPRNSA